MSILTPHNFFQNIISVFHFQIYWFRIDFWFGKTYEGPCEFIISTKFDLQFTKRSGLPTFFIKSVGYLTCVLIRFSELSYKLPTRLAPSRLCRLVNNFTCDEMMIVVQLVVMSVTIYCLTSKMLYIYCILIYYVYICMEFSYVTEFSMNEWSDSDLIN